MNLVRQHASRNSTNLCVTIVEGDIALALALSHNLKTEGYVVESVDRGDEAVRNLADAPPDLVILDWMLAGISGPEICIRLRAEEATRTVPIIMLSARGDESLRLRSFSAGADDFVVKPFSMRELIARVQACKPLTRPIDPGDVVWSACLRPVGIKCVVPHIEDIHQVRTRAPVFPKIKRNAGVYDLICRLLRAKPLVWASWGERRTASQIPIGATHKPRINPGAQDHVIAQSVAPIDRQCSLIRRRVGRRTTQQVHRIVVPVGKNAGPKDCFGYPHSRRQGKIRRQTRYSFHFKSIVT